MWPNYVVDIACVRSMTTGARGSDVMPVARCDLVIRFVNRLMMQSFVTCVAIAQSTDLVNR
jgi:hypothetical protein